MLDISADGRAKQLDELKAFGVDTVRVIVAWRQIAPEPDAASKPAFDATDPAAYPAQNWVALDDLVRGATTRGMNVLLDAQHPGPQLGQPRARPDHRTRSLPTSSSS